MFFTFFRTMGSFINPTTFKILGVIILILGLFFSYRYVEKKFEALDAANALIAEQAKAINSLNEELTKLKKSNEITVAALTELQNKKTEVREVAQKEKVITKTKVITIEKSNLPEAEKIKEISTVYIDDIYVHYCKIDPNYCSIEPVSVP